jgi:hypothetical protein
VAPTPASSTAGPCVVHKARLPPLSPSTLQPADGPSPRSSSLSPHAAPFHPGGSLVGHSKARRWADADPGAGSSDDEPAPVASRPSYLDGAGKALRATPLPSARAAIATHNVAAVERAHWVPAGEKRHQRRCQRRRRRSSAPPPPQLAQVPAQRHLGPQQAVRVLVFQRLGPRWLELVPDAAQGPCRGPNVDADGF